MMELAQLLLTPVTLLTAFIFFWKQTKAISNELRQELKSVKEELKEDIVSVRKDLTSIRVEMRDMNGRLGRVEGLLKIKDSG